MKEFAITEIGSSGFESFAKSRCSTFKRTVTVTVLTPVSIPY